MISFMYYVILMVIILMFMMFMNFILSKKLNKNRDKMSPFECGFDPMSNNRLPFSLQFYLISIIFLIFDVEIALILPMVNSWSYMNYYIYFNIIIIMMILLLGLYMELYEGALNWFK